MNFTQTKLQGSKFLGPLSFYRRALLLALPVMGQLLIQNMVALVDNFMVAGLGDIKMSGVNIAGQINFVFIIFINTICISGGIFMSQYNGAKDSAGMQHVFRFKLVVCVISGIIFTFVSLFCPRPLLSLMVHGNSASQAIIDEGVRYMKVLSFAWIPGVIATSIASSLREIGTVKPPLIISVIATIINTFFNWVLIYGNLGVPRLETAGAAIATIIARVVEMLIFIIYITVKKPPFYLRFVEIFKVKISLFITILRKSALVLVSEMSWVISETITTALYNSRGGAEVVSGMSAGFAIANLFFVCFSGIATVTGVIMGGTLGANKLDEAKQQKTWLESGSIIFGLFMAFIGSLTIFLIPIIYSNLSAEARLVTRGLVLVNALYMPAWALINAQFAVSRTGGDTSMGAVVDLTTNTLLVVPGMFALTYLTGFGPVAMYAIIKITDFVKITLCELWLRKERWLTNLAEKYTQKT